MSFYNLNWRRITNKRQNCHHMLLYSKFSELCFCQILFDIVYSWESYRKKKQKGWTYFSIHSVFLQPSQIYEAYSQDIQQINSFWLMKQLHRYQPVVVRFYSILLTKSVIIITAKHWAAVDNRWWLCSWFSCNNC